MLERAEQHGGVLPDMRCSDLRMMQAGRAALPWQLTDSQEQVVQELLDDLGKGEPMNRLLQGDVGSGKTVVAFMALLAAVGSGAVRPSVCVGDVA